MTNQSTSPFALELNGDIGPIEQMWDRFVQTHLDTSVSEVQRHNMRVVFYIAAAQMFDTMTTCLRRDPSLNLMVMVTEAMAKDFGLFFESPSGSPKMSH